MPAPDDAPTATSERGGRPELALGATVAGVARRLWRESAELPAGAVRRGASAASAAALSAPVVAGARLLAWLRRDTALLRATDQASQRRGTAVATTLRATQLRLVGIDDAPLPGHDDDGVVLRLAGPIDMVDLCVDGTRRRGGDDMIALVRAPDHPRRSELLIHFSDADGDIALHSDGTTAVLSVDRATLRVPASAVLVHHDPDLATPPAPPDPSP